MVRLGSILNQGSVIRIQLRPSTTSTFQQIIDAFLLHPKRGSGTIQYKDRQKVERLLDRIVSGTNTSLQVITDFDFTLTRHHLNGKSCDSTHGVLDRSPRLPGAFKSRSLELYNKYHPIELSTDMTVPEKIPHLIDWYEGVHSSLVTYGKLSRPLLQTIISEANVMLRDNALEFLQILNRAGVPVLVFSAGIGDILQGILQNENTLLPNMTIVSNWMEFNEAGALTGFKDPLIHTRNKNISVLGQELRLDPKRRSCILLGDLSGDIHMADGMANQETILKIGFLNMNIEERLDSFLDAFDIVLVDDQSLDFANLVLKSVVNK